MTATIVYEGNLRCTASHLQSGTAIETDAPTDNRGRGERFSPTDLVCTALATCMVTTMAIKANDMGIDLNGTTAVITKHMLSNPRRIGKIEVGVKYPSTLQLDDKSRTILQHTGDNCPVIKSLHLDVMVETSYS